MVFRYTSWGLGPYQSLFTEMGTIFQSSHTAGIGSGATKDVAGNVLWDLFSAEAHTGGAGIHQSPLNRRVSLHALIRNIQLQNPFVPGTSVGPNASHSATCMPMCLQHRLMHVCVQFHIPTQPESAKPHSFTEV